MSLSPHEQEGPPPSRCSWAARARDPDGGPGTTQVERDGVPLLHTTVGLGPGAPAWLPPVAPRAYASTVVVGPERTPTC